MIFPKIIIFKDEIKLYYVNGMACFGILNSKKGREGTYKVLTPVFCEDKQAAIDNKRRYVRIIVAKQKKYSLTLFFIVFGLLNYMNGILFNNNIRISNLLKILFELLLKKQKENNYEFYSQTSDKEYKDAKENEKRLGLS